MGTSISEVSMSGFGVTLQTQGKGSYGKTEGKSSDFQMLFDKQTGDLAKTVEEPKNLQTAKAGKVNNKHADRLSKQRPDEKNKEPDEEEVKEAAENAAQVLLTEISEILSVDAKALAEEMEMEPTDLLEGPDLNALLMRAAGVEDSLNLLTNEGLYEDFKQIMEMRDDLVAKEASELGLSTEEFLETTAQITGETPAISSEDAADNKSFEIVSDNENSVLVTAQEETVIAKSGESADTSDKKSGSEQPSGNDQGAMAMPGQIGTDAMLQQTVTGEETEVSQTPDTQNIMRQILDFMKVQIKPDLTEMEMQLHPASLGTLQVHLASKGGTVTAQFITQSEAVKAAVESQMISLQESFREQGIKVEAIEVSVQTNEFNRNLDRGNDGQTGNGERKNTATRRIRLDGTDLLEDLDEEEQLAVDMMVANGNTVDFTV